MSSLQLRPLADYTALLINIKVVPDNDTNLCFLQYGIVYGRTIFIEQTPLLVTIKNWMLRIKTKN